MYETVGTLMLASRMRRLGERLFAEITKTYRSQFLPFEPSWFPVFYLLDRDKNQTISSMAREMGVTDSAVSQLIRQLKAKKLITQVTNKTDNRSGNIGFTPKGAILLNQVKPVWQSIQTTIEATLSSKPHSKNLLKGLGDLEHALDQNDFYLKVGERIAFQRLLPELTLSQASPPHQQWINDLLLTFSMAPHPQWDDPIAALKRLSGNRQIEIKHSLLLHQQSPLALVVSSSEKNPKTLSHTIHFIASPLHPNDSVEDHALAAFCSGAEGSVWLSVKMGDHPYLNRLLQLGFKLGSLGSSESQTIDFIFTHP